MLHLLRHEFALSAASCTCLLEGPGAPYILERRAGIPRHVQHASAQLDQCCNASSLSFSSANESKPLSTCCGQLAEPVFAQPLGAKLFQHCLTCACNDQKWSAYSREMPLQNCLAHSLQGWDSHLLTWAADMNTKHRESFLIYINC